MNKVQKFKGLISEETRGPVIKKIYELNSEIFNTHLNKLREERKKNILLPTKNNDKVAQQSLTKIIIKEFKKQFGHQNYAFISHQTARQTEKSIWQSSEEYQSQKYLQKLLTQHQQQNAQVPQKIAECQQQSKSHEITQSALKMQDLSKQKPKESKVQQPISQEVKASLSPGIQDKEESSTLQDKQITNNPFTTQKPNQQSNSTSNGLALFSQPSKNIFTNQPQTQEPNSLKDQKQKPNNKIFGNNPSTPSFSFFNNTSSLPNNSTPSSSLFSSSKAFPGNNPFTSNSNENKSKTKDKEQVSIFGKKEQPKSSKIFRSDISSIQASNKSSEILETELFKTKDENQEMEDRVTSSVQFKPSGQSNSVAPKLFTLK